MPPQTKSKPVDIDHLPAPDNSADISGLPAPETSQPSPAQAPHAAGGSWTPAPMTLSSRFPKTSHFIQQAGEGLKELGEGTIGTIKTALDPRVPVVGATHMKDGMVQIDPNSMLGTITSGLPELASRSSREWKEGAPEAAIVHGAESYIPFIGPWMSSITDQAMSGDTSGAIARGGASGAGSILLGKIGEKVGVLPERMREVRGALDRETLNDRATKALGKEQDLAQDQLTKGKESYRGEVGEPYNQIKEADAAKFPEGDLTSDNMREAMLDDLKQKNGQFGSNSRKAYDEIEQTRGMKMSFDDLRALRTRLSRLLASTKNPMERSTITAALDSASNTLQDRADELGLKDHYNKANAAYAHWRQVVEPTLTNLASRTNYAEPRKFWQDVANRSNRDTTEAMNAAGVREPILEKAKQLQPITRFAAQPEGGTLMGRFRAFKEHPLAAGVGALMGANLLGFIPGVGRWIGAIGGASGAADLATRIGAERALGESAPDLAGRALTTRALNEYEQGPKPPSKAHKVGQTLGRIGGMASSYGAKLKHKGEK